MSPIARIPILLSWSSGKDCAFALDLIRREGIYEVVGLVTTFNEVFGRVAMHGVPAELVDLQADAVGVPLWCVPIPWPCTNDEYERAMSGMIERAVSQGIGHFAFGDLFLEDIRSYRESRLQGTGMKPVFPVWRADTAALAAEMLAAGTHATIACVDLGRLDLSFAGREFDEAFLRDLPPGTDPCGENGEFHTFAWDGPAFSHPVPTRTFGAIERDGFGFADLRPAADG